MVHALEEAHRVLKSGGILIDLRPAASHRRAGLGTGPAWKLVGVLHESLDDDRAANAAIAAVLRRGLFKQLSRVGFDLERMMDTGDDFRLWISDSVGRGKFPGHENLIRRIERAQDRAKRKTPISVRGLMTLGVLQKV